MQAYVSCNLGRDVTSSRCGSLVDGRSSSIPSCASVAVVNGPKFNLDMIVHPFTSRFNKNSVEYPITCVLPHTDCVCQRTWSTMPTTCWFGRHTAPMSEDFICHGLCRLSAPEQNKNRSPGSTVLGGALHQTTDNGNSPSSLFSLIVQHSVKCAIILAKIVHTLTCARRKQCHCNSSSEAQALQQHHVIVPNRKSTHDFSTSTMSMFSVIFMRCPQLAPMTIASLFQYFSQMSLGCQEQEEIHDRCPASLHTLSGVRHAH